MPEVRFELRPGRAPGSQQGFYLDIGLLRADTGFQPAYDVVRGVAE